MPTWIMNGIWIIFAFWSIIEIIGLISVLADPRLKYSTTAVAVTWAWIVCVVLFISHLIWG